ncbi:MAG: DUF4743 domain-containing protein [Rhodospirillales bacterium]
MSLIDRLDDCARFSPEAYRPFTVDGHVVGRIRHEFADTLGAYPGVFVVAEKGVSLAPTLQGAVERTKAVAGVLEDLHAQGLFPGWRGEHYPVSVSYYAEPLLTIERATVPKFGTMGYGVHINGFVRDAGGLKMWIGKRSMKKPTGPGKLDQVVAGGLPVGISVWKNLLKECGEEAGMPVALAQTAVPIGTVSYLTERAEGLRHDVLFNYDIELPADFEPTPTDGEVDAFYLWPIEEVMQRIRESDDFKFNAALVIIDFAIRHGVLTPDDPDYITVTEAIRLGRHGATNVR